ncbi:phosphoglycerate mutase family protein [Massarina eburnea CBS 473.64]|uniref:Phosphoglycerate mutase family protein n=1 Tax=Massarina eburnea CBS 473.64 TaxID=1395130 RepID=A0A6A6RJ54_9PLEO|nr:phosphoglycerate mutase family protein [Massarina eburnea CBS 473.64]
MSVPTPAPTGAFHYEFEVLQGYFKQSENDTDDSEFDFLKEKFGLIDRTYPTDSSSTSSSQWKHFAAHIRHLNQNSTTGESIKVLFLGRHGQGWHNVAETKYGTEAWDCKYSMLDGYDGIHWSDANLTELGQEQAKAVHALWESELKEGIPTPETFYVSPLTRTIETADLSFKGLQFGDGREYKPFIKELLREALGVHTCDRRSTASHILQTFPHITLEAGFSDPDLLWEEDYREPRSARTYRLGQLLDDIFETDDGVFLSLTSHSGAIGSILEAVGHRAFSLQTGGVIPVLVRAKRVDEERVKPAKEPSEGPPACKEALAALAN